MKTEDEEREHRILYDIVVDAYDEYEQNMGWYYYFEENLNFPIPIIAKLRNRKGFEKTHVEIVSITSEGNAPIRLGICESNSDRIISIKLEDVISANTTDENLQILNDWLYWHDYSLLK